MNEQETIVDVVATHRTLRGCLTWLVFLASIIILGVAGVAVWRVWAYLPILGLFILASVGVLLCTGMAAAIIYTVRLFFQAEMGEIGPTGSYVHRSITGHVTTITPLAIEQARIEKPAVTVIEIPTVAELLAANLLGGTDLMLGCAQSDGKPHYGLWDNVRTFCIAGKGRAGKTITMFFIAIQAILNGATVWVCDPHAKKKSSITMLLRPLGQWVRFAHTDEEIADLVGEFVGIMENRLDTEHPDETPQLLVVDEFTRMVEGNEQVYDAVIACAQQYAGVYGYALIAGHEWTGNGKKLAKLRRALHAKFVHRLDEGYARYLLNSPKLARTTEKLRTGYCYLQDTDGDIHELRIPLGTVQDALTVAERLRQLSTPADVPRIEPLYQVELPPGAETETFQAETEPLLSLPAPETKSFQAPEEKLAEMRRLRMLNFNQSQIIQNIWRVKPGATQAYESALAEYKQLLERLVRSA